MEKNLDSDFESKTTKPQEVNFDSKSMVKVQEFDFQSKTREAIQDFVGQDFKTSSELMVKKTPFDFDLNVPPDRGFDLNKFPEEKEEEGETIEQKEHRRIVRKMLKIFLPKYY